MPSVSTPCIKLCVLDPLSGLCDGCGRTIDEITQWGSLGDAGRIAIMAALPGRLAAARTARLAAAGPEEPQRAPAALQHG